MRSFARVYAAQKTHAVNDAFVTTFANTHWLTPPRANREQNRIVAAFKSFQRDALTQWRVEVDLKTWTFVFQSLNVFLDDSGRQTEFGNTPDHCSTGTVCHLIDVDLKSCDT